MPTDHRAELRKIRDFRSLIPYLRDEMGWPIEQDSLVDVDNLFFEYTAEELGVDPKNAAKIKSIRQLRPLKAGQPFGVFFVQFEPKRLPVVALRRILSHVVIKKRASANKADRAVWQSGDLIFVSSYGAGDERQISFAHFADNDGKGDLPTLKVLGWDNLDTALHLDAVATELTQHLTWPENERDINAWRERWRGAFTLRHREVVDTSKELSIRLAELARAIRDRAKTALAIETERGPLTKLLRAFQQALVHELDVEGFADMYAQTIAYGLLSARIADPRKRTADDFAGHMRTNPFLRELMATFLEVGGRRGKAGGPGIDFDELGVSEVVELLDDANMEAIVRDFGDRNPQEDPVIHFYEHFLSAYNKQLKIQRGVFYTPQSVVSYIVRSAHELLQTEFGLADGLADITTWGQMVRTHAGLKLPPLTNEPGEKRTISPDEPFVQILDPATGTATFLVEVIDVIHRTLAATWKQQHFTDVQQRAAWNDYVPKHLLPRLHGFELMMAPYAIAHMKIGLKLAETGYRFGTEERGRIYLTNALEPWVKQLPLIGFDALAHEAAAVNEIKRYKRFTVVIGNPPYSVSTQNRGEWALSLIARFKEGLNEKKHTLDDDYVKFVAFSQWCIDASGLGVWGFITNHGFLKNPTFREMRNRLIQSFSDLRIYDLHGNSRQKEQTVATGTDENVFDIQQGVAITLGTKRTFPTKETESWFTELWGARSEKYRLLSQSSVRSSNWNPLGPCEPFFLLVPQDKAIREEYVHWPGLTEAFGCFGSGIKTDRDELCMDSIKRALVERMTLLFSGKYDAEFVEQFNIRPSSSYDVVELARRTRFIESDITRCLYRPFDIRWLYYKRGFTSRPAYEVMQHMLPGGNLGLLSARTNKSGEMDHFLCTRLPTEVKVAESTTQSCVFPLYLAEDSMRLQLSGHRALNFEPAFLRRVAETLSVPQDGVHALPAGFTPEDIFQYAYAVFHSPGYRSRYAEFLKIDFPRLALTGNVDLFVALAQLGGELVALHVLESPKLDHPITEFIGGRNPDIEKLSWSKNTVWVDKAQTTGFKGVREDVWKFHIGGYQVCEKWLKDRKGRTLSKDDIAHYQKIVVALAETIRLMKEIDEVIEQHGGWPGAFDTKRVYPAREPNGLFKVAEGSEDYNPESV